jgi:hypothetical protein
MQVRNRSTCKPDLRIPLLVEQGRAGASILSFSGFYATLMLTYMVYCKVE